MKQPEADPSVPPTEDAPGSPAAPGPDREINNMSHSSAESDDDQPVDHIPHNEELPKWRLYLLTFSLGLANLLVALDTSILGSVPVPVPFPPGRVMTDNTRYVRTLHSMS